MHNYTFFNRDISWLSFNERVLLEAASDEVPLLERFRFLAIYSSNLDEFYRVRMPAMVAMKKIDKSDSPGEIYREANYIISRQQQLFGKILTEQLIPALQAQQIELINNGTVPDVLLPALTEYFFNKVAGLLQPVLLTSDIDFFPGNNLLYLAAISKFNNKELVYLVNIPCDHLARFFRISHGKKHFVLFLEDIIMLNLQHVLAGEVQEAYNIKITRDAELELEDEYDEDLAVKIEKQLKKRDMGYATRFLYQPGFPLRQLQYIIEVFNLQKASVVEGGRHHHLRDLADLPISGDDIVYPAWPAIAPGWPANLPGVVTLFDQIESKDLMVHTPYMSYDSIIRFFNEAAIDKTVEEIHTTLYRIAQQSRIALALISAAKNGKKVTVLVELKARFDEANNIQWAKRMKDAGVKIIYSDNKLKVHAKVALVKRVHQSKPYVGLLATGNLNESTARFYTDHILLTSQQQMLGELDILFSFLAKQKKPSGEHLNFKHLLVAQFNMQQIFLQLLDREMNNAASGLRASVVIKVNNLEEEVMIRKLYDVSNAGVKVQMIVRSICRLVPGVKDQSEHITVKRIVDRYLEHGRVFIFHNNGSPNIWMGSADWMNRNMYRRIEVCFPVYDEYIKRQIIDIIQLQLEDNVSAVYLSDELVNLPVAKTEPLVRSQQAIYQLLQA